MKEEKRQYIGNQAQLLRVETYKTEGGRQDGVRSTLVTNESGLSYTVVADRCMDIAYLSYKGYNISFINPNGIVAPQYYDRTGTNWLKNFTAGFFTTCGLNNVGNPCVDGEELGLHGSIGNTPAESYCVKTIQADDNRVEISGMMNDSTIFGRKLKLNRQIVSYQEKNRIIVEDEIVNEGFTEEEYMQLYHCNIGYPFLSQDCQLYITGESVEGANSFSQENLSKWNQIEEPSQVGEMCFIHKLIPTEGTYRVGMFNHKLSIGFTLTFPVGNLDTFLQWRYLHKGEYVVGLEPATNLIGGRAEERKNGRLKTIPPLSSVKHYLQYDFFDSLAEFENQMNQK